MVARYSPPLCLLYKPRVNLKITHAITFRRVLAIRYKDDKTPRSIEPHAYGRGRKGGEILLAWQRHGASGSRSFGWRHFDVDEIASIESRDESFAGPRSNYRADSTTLTEIFSEIGT